MSLAPDTLPEKGAATGNFIEIQGTDRLIEAASVLLYNPLMDAVVIRGMIDSEDALSKLDNPYSSPKLNILYVLAPELHELDEVAMDFWNRFGYEDFSVQLGLRSAGLNRKERGLHTDISVDRDRRLTGPMTLSVCIAGSGLFELEKSSERLVKPDGKYDSQKYYEMSKVNNLPTDDLRTEIPHSMGDGLLFVNHPTPTYHAVKSDEGVTGNQRVAALFDYVADRK